VPGVSGCQGVGLARALHWCLDVCCCEELTTALRLSSKFYVTGRLRARDEARGEDEEGKKNEDDKLSHEGGV
jgi:hypothetical protein